jgi:hypothetical protein
MVYGYLTHTVSLDWIPDQNVKGDKWVPMTPLVPTYVVFDNTPLPHVLRINSQIRDEYMESDCFVHLSASTDATDGAAGYADAYLIPLEARKSPEPLILWNRANGYKSVSSITESAQETYWLECALSHVMHLLILKDGMKSDELCRLEKFVYGIAYMAPGLLTVKIALQGVNMIDKLWHLELLQGKVKNLATTRGYYIPKLHCCIAGLQLLQGADSYRLKPGEFIPVTEIGQYPQAYPHIIHGRANVGFHMPVVSAVFLYGSNSVHKKHFWNSQQLLDLWPIPGNHARAGMFEYKSDEEAELINNLSLRMLDWKEERKEAAAQGYMERNYGANERTRWKDGKPPTHT